MEPLEVDLPMMTSSLAGQEQGEWLRDGCLSVSVCVCVSACVSARVIARAGVCVCVCPTLSQRAYPYDAGGRGSHFTASANEAPWN